MRHSRLIVLYVSALLAGFLAQPAFAQQSQRELREENDRLRAQVEDLQRELEAAREEVRRLQALVTSLEKRLAAEDLERPERDGADQKTQPTLEEGPHDSPRALLREAARQYRETLSGMEQGDSADSAQRTAYLRALRQWTARFNREMRGQVRWPVQIVRNVRRVDRDYIVEMQMADPKTGATIGDAFRALVPRSVADRLAEREREMNLMEEAFLLHGTLIPNVQVNPDRATKGAFNNPPLIGPYAEFGFAVEARALTLWEEREDAQDGDAQGDAGSEADDGEGNRGRRSPPRRTRPPTEKRTPPVGAGGVRSSRDGRGGRAAGITPFP
mgnify:CR=1 FL=1